MPIRSEDASTQVTSITQEAIRTPRAGAVAAGLVLWIDLVFPAWVFGLNIHILVASFRSPGLRIRRETAGAQP